MKSKYLVGFILLTSCSTSYRKEFENLADIEIPNSAIVTKQEYQDMMQDFSKIYEIKLDKVSLGSIKGSILKSMYYDSTVFSENGVIDSKSLRPGIVNGLWYQSSVGFSFYAMTKDKRRVVIAKIDSISMTAKFEYGFD
ncbi:hypothetical protein [Flavihumibacter profundi]|uniref:hypothetical protein n=1 Tax=Flavihumibacter profundi TaxID=2716883 RepID=UPI001CC573AB|nr:hypothetical protein [Flavihumibacter profundi]MBZ5857317.1 hypothetical protein [Flavihumibacter profundi]